MENVDNTLEVSDTVEESVDKPEEQLTFFKLKENHGFNETNLMTLPFISLKRKKIDSFERTWKKSNNEIVSIEVIGGKNGVPQIAELDVLLALFRIHLKNNKNGFFKNKETKITKIPQRIHFTYTELAKEVGYKDNSGFVKKKLETSIKKLNETTIYNKYAIMDAEQGKYISTFKGEKSCRILKNYTSYTKEDYKKENDGKLMNPYQVKDMQYVEIDDFFLNNMCNNYYKIYDYQKYKGLKMAIAKKIFLILNTWSKGNSKNLTYQVLADYIGLDFKEKKDQYYAIKQINKAMEDLVEVGYIDGFKTLRNTGVNIIFNQFKLDADNYKHLFKKSEEVLAELRSLGIEYDEMEDLAKKTSPQYLVGVLRRIRYKKEVKGEHIEDNKKYFLSAFSSKWDVKQFLD
ncbi:MAG: replication initiator protein A [Bacilli bacterium]